MCTVTFVPSKEGVLITSNRDEKSWRKQAFPPTFYTHNDVSLVYPKDADAGGTWIAVKENGDAAVLLNGALEKHISSPPYKKSRGIVFLEIISAANPTEHFSTISLEGIEPFTMIIFSNNELHEVRWNSIKKFASQLNENKAHIWSSATLYDALTVKKREAWFSKWQINNLNPTAADALTFHQFAGDGDSKNDLHMNRGGVMLTVSVTGILLKKNKAIMQYIDLKNNTTHETEVSFDGHLQATLN